MVDQRLQSEAARDAMREAWKALDGHSKKNLLLGHMLREFQNGQEHDLSATYSRLVGEINGDPRKRPLLDAVDDKVRDDLVLYMLFPETHLVDYLIEEIESAAQADDGLQPGEQVLKDQLKHVREGLGSLNLASAQSWNEIRKRLTGIGSGTWRQGPSELHEQVRTAQSGRRRVSLAQSIDTKKPAPHRGRLFRGSPTP